MDRKTIERILMAGIAIALLVLTFLLLKGPPAHADGILDDTAKGASFATVPLRGNYRRYPCPPGISPRQCRIINEQAALQLQRRGQARHLQAYIAEPGPRRRYVERDRRDLDEPRRTVRNACGPEPMTGYGVKMITRSLAEGSAKANWDRIVKTELGESYLDLNVARNVDMHCIPVGSMTRCTLRARACRG